MENFFTTIRLSINRYPVAFILGGLLLIQLFSLIWVVPFVVTGDQESAVLLTQGLSESIPKLSEMKGAQIDSQAAAVINEDVCKTVSAGVWIFLLFAYIALLVYNFSYRFKESVRIQWFWELIYTLLFVLVWLLFDECFIHSWFPFMLIETGLIVFGIYAYLFEKKRSIEELLF